MTDLGSVLHSGKRSDLELNDLLQHLKIREDEDQEIVLEEDLEGFKARARWIVLAKVLSPPSPSAIVLSLLI
jgi:hypothetical protein